MKKGKIGIEEIKTLVTKCEKIYETDLFAKFEEDQQFYELEFKSQLDMPIEFSNEGIVLPTARDMIDTFVDHIDIGNARVFVNRKSTSNIAAEEAEMMRKFYLGLIHRTNVESDISPWRVAAKHYALHGLAVLKTVWDADRWPDKPQRLDGESEDAYADRIDQWRHETHQSIPIIIQSINPRNVMPDPSSAGRLFVIEKHKKMCIDVSKRWPHWKNPQGKEIDKEVEFISYWDDTYRCDLADGQPVLKVRGGVAKHNYGFIPYTFIDSGLGNISYDARPEMRYVGMLRYMTDLLIAESRDFSIADVVLKREAWPSGFLTGENASQVTKIKQTYGTWDTLPEGVTPVPMTKQMPPDALNLHLARTSDYIASHAAPRSVRGLSEIGVRSGADRRLIIAEASARYQYSAEAFKHGAAKVLTNCASLLKNVIPGDVRVWARTPTDEFDVVIDKDKMREPFTCYVEFAPISEEDEYRRHDDLERLVSSLIVTKRWARTQMSNVDPLAMEREEEKERLKASPMFNQLKDQYLTTKFQEALAELEVPTSGVVPGTPMGGSMREPGRRLVPPTTERAPLGSAEEMQRRMAAMRSQTPMSPTQGQGGGGQR